MAPSVQTAAKAPAVQLPAKPSRVQSPAVPRAIQAAAQAPSRQPPAQPSPVSKPAVRAKILFVDDTSDWRYLGASFLGERWYKVVTAEDPISAMLQVSQFKPNLVVLDLNLGGQSAVALLKVLSKRNPDVPVLVYTGMDLAESEAAELLEQGAWNWLRKGSLEELGAAVEKTIGGPKATVPQTPVEPVAQATESQIPRAALSDAESATQRTSEEAEEPECVSAPRALDSLRTATTDELLSAVEKEIANGSVADVESAVHPTVEETEAAPECDNAFPSLDSLRTGSTEELLSAVESARSVTPEQTEAVPEPAEVTNDVIESAAESILIIEDDAAFTDTLRSFLESQSFRVSGVSSGKEAVSLITAADVDLVLFDLTLPGMSVDQFYGAVKAVKPHLCQRIIFMTSDDSHPTDDSFVRRLKGISLWKPFPMDWLLEAVQTIRAGTPQDRLVAK